MQNTKIRKTVVKIILAMIRPLIEAGVLTAAEYSVISKNLNHLVTHGELAPPAPPRLITPQEAAEVLGISYSQFRALEKEGTFPFRRRTIGGKTVRYLNLEILEYMLIGSVEKEDNK